MFLRKRFPYLYKYNTDFGLKTFIAWLADAIYQSAILFFLPLLIFGDGVIWSNGKEGSFLVLGNIIYTVSFGTKSLKTRKSHFPLFLLLVRGDHGQLEMRPGNEILDDIHAHCDLGLNPNVDSFPLRVLLLLAYNPYRG